MAPYNLKTYHVPLRHKLNKGGSGNSGGSGGSGSSEDLRRRLNARSRDPEPPSKDFGDMNLEEKAGGGNGGGGERGRGSRQNHKRVQGRGAGGTLADNSGRGQNNQRNRPDRSAQQQQQQQPINNGNLMNGLPRPKRNTENFNPSHEAPQMRILCAPAGLKKWSDYKGYATRDVLVVNDLYCEHSDLTIYKRLLKEMEECGVDQDRLWQSWHGDSHLIADDKKRWKDACPTFNMVLDRLAEYFDMDIKVRTKLSFVKFAFNAS